MAARGGARGDRPGIHGAGATLCARNHRRMPGIVKSEFAATHDPLAQRGPRRGGENTIADRTIGLSGGAGGSSRGAVAGGGESASRRVPRTAGQLPMSAPAARWSGGTAVSEVVPATARKCARRGLSASAAMLWGEGPDLVHHVEAPDDVPVSGRQKRQRLAERGEGPTAEVERRLGPRRGHCRFHRVAQRVEAGDGMSDRGAEGNRAGSSATARNMADGVPQAHLRWSGPR